MEIAVAAFALAGLVIAVVFAVRYSKKRDEEVQRIWKSFARANGLRWTDSAGGFWSRKSYEAHGEAAGVPVRVHKYVVRTGKRSVIYTRFIGKLPRGVQHKLRVCRRFLGTKLAELFGSPSVDTGDARFDARMALRSASREEALEIVGPLARERILGFPKELWVECKGDDAQVWWYGAETDPRVLESGLDVLTALCGAGAGAPARPIQ